MTNTNIQHQWGISKRKFNGWTVNQGNDGNFKSNHDHMYLSVNVLL